MGAATKCVVWAAAVCGALIALPVLAQSVPPVCQDGGSLGNCAPWIDNNGNGVYDGGDQPILTMLGTSSADIAGPWGSGTIWFTNVKTPALLAKSAVQGYNAAQWGGFCAAVTLTNEAEDPIGFALWDNNTGPCFYTVAENARAQSSLGAMNLEDTNNDGAYEELLLWDTRSTALAAQTPYLRTNIICTDNNRDGDCDHYSLPWSNSQLLGMDPEDKQIWVPKDQAEPRITFNDPMFHRTARLAARQETSIPTLSQWGLLVSLVGLAAAGWWVLRRKQVVA